MAANVDLGVIFAQALMCTIPLDDMRGNVFTGRISREWAVISYNGTLVCFLEEEAERIGDSWETEKLQMGSSCLRSWKKMSFLEDLENQI